MTGRRGLARADRVRRWWQTAAVALLLGAFLQTADADGEVVVEADRVRAARLVEQADKAGDRRDSQRLLLRAVRWDPTRADDYERAINALSKADPAAALRHAEVALRRDSPFGAGNPALLSRLIATASESESWATAAELARRHREVVFGQTGVSRQRRAELELSVSRLEFLAGDIGRASDGFDRLRRLRYGLPIGEPVTGELVPWQFAATCHLEAGHPDRAEEAISQLARQRGETAEVDLLRARLALARNEPLAAIQHAIRAIDSPSPAGRLANGYDVLVESFSAANQTAQASDWLQRATDAEPEAVGPSIGLVEVLNRLGQQREAWIESRRLLDRLLDLTNPFDPLLDPTSSDQEAADRRIDLAIAAEQWLIASVEQGEFETILKTLPAIAAKLGGLDPIAAAMDEALGQPPFREAAQDGLATAERGALAVSPQGYRRAMAFLALRLADAETYEELTRSRIEEALKGESNRKRVEREVGLAAVALGEIPSGRSSQQLLSWAIDRFKEIDGSRAEEAAPLLAGLRLQLAGAIAQHLPDDAAKRRAAIDQAVSLLTAARGGATPENGVGRTELFVFLRCGLFDRAIEAGERVVASQPLNAAGSASRREGGLLLEEALAARDATGDLSRRVELLEAILDEWPDHPEPLLRLATAFAEQARHLSRAERMARRAVEAEPGWPIAIATLGHVRYQFGDAAEAAALLRQAIERIDAGAEITPTAADAIRDRYAAVLAALGRAEQAAAEAAP